MRAPAIEEGWRKKPRQTVGVVLWGKIAAHMASLSLRQCSRQVDKRRAGSKLGGGGGGGDICILHILSLIDWFSIKCSATFYHNHCVLCFMNEQVKINL